MNATIQLISVLNSLFFLFYGFKALQSETMIAEFKRFGMTDFQKKMTGLLQITGSTGMLAGLFFPLFGLLSSTGFTFMMLVAFMVRIKIKDSIVHYSPSLFFILVNSWLMVSFYKLLP